ncbi:hypothetical protein QVD17_11912 [Tagetes erecta]|uniref:Uncharacterized protein n=1 Tax=Tagetes erecta TaxID=13708 RepID=A0AAD8KV54_TARER|nr:hypothetical protein QVD17_11912 [Tagetes erecta]
MEAKDCTRSDDAVMTTLHDALENKESDPHRAPAKGSSSKISNERNVKLESMVVGMEGKHIWQPPQFTHQISIHVVHQFNPQIGYGVDLGSSLKLMIDLGFDCGSKMMMFGALFTTWITR